MTDAGTHILDLGELDERGGPVLCFGGPYSNLQATEAVLAEAARRGIPPNRVICTGDVVAYCGDPSATTVAIRDAGIHVVMGNCEEQLGFNGADCNCGFEDGSDCAQWSQSWFAHAAADLSEETLSWMQDLPRQIRFTLSGRRFAVIHGGADNISEYVFASSATGDKARNFDRLDQKGPPDTAIDAVIGGHSGLPFTQFLGGRLWHNAGAIGMPANDGTPRGWFSLLSPASDGIDITILALDYDHQAAAAALRASQPDLPYAKTLESGLWPNMAVLPDAEQKRRGQPLNGQTVHWPRRRNAAAE